MANRLIEFTQDGRSVGLFDDGSVTIDGATTAKPWSTASAPGVAAPANLLRYFPMAAAGAPKTVAIAYDLDKDNRLSITVAGKTAGPLNGQIELEGRGGLRVVLVDDFGDEADAPTFFVYGSVKIDPAADTLTVTDTTGHPTVLKGTPNPAANMHSAVSAGSAAPDPTRPEQTGDLLTFHAESLVIPAEGPSFHLAATIGMKGAWDLSDGQIKFRALAQMGGGPTKIDIGLVGHFKGVAAGFNFHRDANSTELLFTVEGKINGKNSEGEWEFTMGVSKRRFTADLKVSSAPRIKDGNGFTITGEMHVGKTGGSKVTLGLELTVGYKFEGGLLSLTVSRAGSQYSLALSGQLRVAKDYKATFEVTATPKGITAFSLEFGDAGAGTALGKALNLYIKRTGATITAGLSIDVMYLNGVIVPADALNAPATP